MSEIANYGPLSDPNAISKAKERISGYKDKKADTPLKYRAQEATMRVFKGITEGSLSIVRTENEGMWGLHGFTLGTVALAASVLGASSLGIQKLAEAQFGKSIDLSKNKMKPEYLATISKDRIDKNVARGVIDKGTGEILKKLKEMLKEVRPQKTEKRQLDKEIARMAQKLRLLESEIGPKSETLKTLTENQKQLPSEKGSTKIDKLTEELKNLQANKKGIEAEKTKKEERQQALNKEIQTIEDKYKKQLEDFANAKESKIEETNQHTQDKKLLQLEKNIEKKYKGEDLSSSAAKFFDQKYKAYVEDCIRRHVTASSEDDFIKDYYKRKGIDLS